MPETSPASELQRICHHLARIGLGTSTSGNVSARDGARILLTPTGVAMADVRADRLSITDLDGKPLNDIKPTKEVAFHLAIYRRRPDVHAIVHAHPTHAIAASTFLDASARQFLPAVTPQFVMRAGLVPVLPYHPPGSPQIAEDAAAAAGDARALLLQNHGAITFAATFSEAMGAMEELEENCKQWLWVRQGGRVLSADEVAILLKRKM